MKRTIVCIIFALIATFLIIPSLSGCDNNSENDVNLPDFVYLPEVIPFPLPEDIEWISNVTVTGDSLYFTAYNL